MSSPSMKKNQKIMNHNKNCTEVPDRSFTSVQMVHTHTHHLSHTVFLHTIFHTPLCLTPSFTYTTLSHTIFHHTIFHTQLCRTPSFTTPSFTHTQLCHTPSFATPSFRHYFVTHHLLHTIFVTRSLSHATLSHTPSFFVTHHLSHTTLSPTTLFYFLILHHLLCLSFLPRPRYNIWCSLLEEVALWGYPVL